MLELKNIRKTYHGKCLDVPVLKGINLTIQKGDFITIVGKSGCGKSTLLNILGCMDYADEGEYLFMGSSIQAYKDKQLAYFRNQNIGFVFQSFYLINEISVRENVEVPMGFLGVKAKERRKRALELLCMVGLEEKAESKPLELSGGQQQRVAIARALANNPKVLLCDEPTGNLDEENGKIIIELLANLHAKGATIVMVTHDMSFARYGNRIVKIVSGEEIVDV
ncbi:MAG: ABC transporter ATP-binding protein [Roseburia sp.]|nr:ABC transporter ATP-binding protein [Roseburia sp.]MCM1279013.1 ABC transporter ATP-binding protein [Robinsoniella sp.]